LNNVRTKPKEFVSTLEAYKGKFGAGDKAKENTVYGVTKVTSEGVAAVDAAIAKLNALVAVSALTRSAGINMSAKKLVEY
jgi:hypothetical protein